MRIKLLLAVVLLSHAPSEGADAQARRIPGPANAATDVAFYNYGYRSAWDLGPAIEVRETRLPLEPTAKSR